MKISVVKQRTLWWGISTLLIVIGIGAMALSWQQYGAPLRLGLDFAGGTRLQLTRDCDVASCEQPIQPSEVRDVLNQQDLGNSSIQVIGEDQQSLSIRTVTLDVDERTELQTALSEAIGPFDSQSLQIDTVGPVIGQQLLASGLLALVVAFAGIIAYLSLRFQFDYALFAILALFHDVLITVGLFAVFGVVAGIEVDSLFIVALLTIVGFSVNDTVVIYDRIRETLKQNPGTHIDEIVDDAVSQTLMRSINTTLTTVLTLVAIFLFGGETLKFFALALIIGFLSGAYSSIFIASTLLAFWRERSGNAYAPQPVEGTADKAEQI